MQILCAEWQLHFCLLERTISLTLFRKASEVHIKWTESIKSSPSLPNMLNLPTCLRNTWSYQKLGSGQAPLTVQVSLPDHVYWCRRNNCSDRQPSTIFLVISTMHKDQSSSWQEQIHLEGHCASSFSHISGHQSWFEDHVETWHFLLKIRCTSTPGKFMYLERW